mgnify:CR=1 FL=1
MTEADTLVENLLKSIAEVHMNGGPNAFRVILKQAAKINSSKAKRLGKLAKRIRFEAEGGLLRPNDPDVLRALGNLEGLRRIALARRRQSIRFRQYTATGNGHAVPLCGND